MSDEEEEEEHLVYMVFDGLVDKELFERPDVHFKLIGVETEQPVMQLGGQVYAGEYRDTTGTAVFFEETEPERGDPIFSQKLKHQLKYVCQTRKALHMTRVFLNEKKADSENTAGMEVSAPDKDAEEHDNGIESISCDQLSNPSIARPEVLQK